MRGRLDWRKGAVIRAQTVADGVRAIELVVDGGAPAFDPGSHTTLELEVDGARTTRSYTCLPPLRPGTLRIAVKLHPNGRGGSRRMWTLVEGAPVKVSLPENRFELSWRAGAYLLVAGGIGITPIFGMAMALKARGKPVRLAYGARRRGELAFGAQLRESLGPEVEFFVGDEGRRIDLAAEIAALPPNGELYICGPIGMLNEARGIWARQGRPASRLRFEVFGDSGLLPQTPFAVRVINCDVRIDVGEGQTLLDALTDAGIEMIWDCRRGECGLCAVDIVESNGRIDHRDVFYSEAEKREARHMCACVSRISGGEAVIDIGYRI